MERRIRAGRVYGGRGRVSPRNGGGRVRVERAAVPRGAVLAPVHPLPVRRVHRRRVEIGDSRAGVHGRRRISSRIPRRTDDLPRARVRPRDEQQVPDHLPRERDADPARRDGSDDLPDELSGGGVLRRGEDEAVRDVVRRVGDALEGDPVVRVGVGRRGLGDGCTCACVISQGRTVDASCECQVGEEGACRAYLHQRRRDRSGRV